MFKNNWNVFDFSYMMTLRKYLTKNFENLFWKNPYLAPQNAVSAKRTTQHCLWPLFNCRILFYSKNLDICKKTRAQYVKIWLRYEGLKLNFFFYKFIIFPPANEKDCKSVSFQDFFDFFPFMVSKYSNYQVPNPRVRKS